jgi:hypothetical protein
MTAVNYDKRSPYSQTKQTRKYVQYLDSWTQLTVPSASDDQILTLDTKYVNRPDLLAYDLYGSAQYWWVFAIRNPDVIKDPIYDFTAGITIYAPKKLNIGTYNK